MSWWLADQIKSSVGCLGVQILRGGGERNSGSISCLSFHARIWFPAYIWLFLDDSLYQFQHIIHVTKHRADGSACLPRFGFQVRTFLAFSKIKLSLFWSTVALILISGEVLLWDLLRFLSDSDQSCKMQSLPWPVGEGVGGGTDCHAFPLRLSERGLDSSGGPEAGGWIAPSPDTDAERPFTAETTFRNEHVRMPPERPRSAKPQRPSGPGRNLI